MCVCCVWEGVGVVGCNGGMWKGVCVVCMCVCCVYVCVCMCVCVVCMCVCVCEVTFICPLAGRVTSGALMVGSFSCFARGASWRGVCSQEGKWAARPSPSPSCVAMVMGVHLG